MSLEIACFSLYSDASILSMASLESNRNLASALARSVLPVPVGPTKRKLAMGRSWFERPERLRRIASATAETASSWPTTSLRSDFSMRRSFCFSVVCKSEGGEEERREGRGGAERQRCGARTASEKMRGTHLHVGDGDARPLRDDGLDRLGRDRVAGERLATLGAQLALLGLLLLLELDEAVVELGDGVVAQVGGGREAVAEEREPSA